MYKTVLLVLLFATPLIFTGCSDDNNPTTPLTPTVSGINPSSFPRGAQQVTATISGTNLSGATQVWLGDSMTILSFQSTNATSVSVTFNVQRLAALGPRDISVTTPNGTAVGQGILTVDGAAPVAKYTVSPKDVIENKDIEFNGSNSVDTDGTIQKYQWNFGDGKKAEGKIVTHQFASEGTYDVELTVTDNNHLSNSEIRPLEVSKLTEIKCTAPSKNNGFLGATVIGVEGRYAIVQMDKNRTCANTFYLCGDMRLDEPEIFRGIIKEMYYLGDGKFKILNDCPYQWPPKIGEYDVLIYKRCEVNFCP